MRLLLCCPVPTTDPSTISPKYKLESIRYIKKCIIEYAATAAHHYRPSTGPPLGRHYFSLSSDCPLPAPLPPAHLPTCPLARACCLSKSGHIQSQTRWSDPLNKLEAHGSRCKDNRKSWSMGTQMIT